MSPNPRRFFSNPRFVFLLMLPNPLCFCSNLLVIFLLMMPNLSASSAILASSLFFSSLKRILSSLASACLVRTNSSSSFPARFVCFPKSTNRRISMINGSMTNRFSIDSIYNNNKFSSTQIPIITLVSHSTLYRPHMSASRTTRNIHESASTTDYRTAFNGYRPQL